MTLRSLLMAVNHWLDGYGWLLAFALCCLIFASRASASDSWSGSLQWRGEVVILKSCCGPLKAPVVTRQLEKGYAAARADLDAAGFSHVALPPLGTREHPYTIEVRKAIPPECDCPKGAVCPGCSISPSFKARWTHVVVVDKLIGRAAPVNHELRHRFCALLRPKLVSTAKEILSGGVAKACQWADHNIDKTRRYNVLGQVVPK